VPNRKTRSSDPRFPLGLAALTITLLASPVGARPFSLPDGFHDQLVTPGLQLPTAFAFVPGLKRALVTEQNTGRVRLVVNGAIASIDPVLTVDSLVIGAERGLLGVAVDPYWPARRYVYLNYSHAGGYQSIARYTAIGDVIGAGNGAFLLDPASRHEILRVPDASPQHNAGTLLFGADQKLYASLGDDAVPCDAIVLESSRGRVLRLDVNSVPPGPGGPEALADLVPNTNPHVSNSDDWARLTWAYGFRNPFTFHLDPVTGDCFVADVGELVWEEFDWIPAGTAGGQYGWGWYEGETRSIYTCAGDSAGALPPIFTYDHEDSLENAEAAISAGLYRQVSGGSDNFPAEYDGDYFVSDFYGGWIKRLKRTGDTWAIAPTVSGQPHPDVWATSSGYNSAFAVGPDGGLWYLAMLTDFGGGPSGELRRISGSPVASVPRPPVGDGLALAPPHPSPSSGDVAFRFTLPRAAAVRLEVIDLAGRRVAVLADGGSPAGEHRATWDGRGVDGRTLPAGVYHARLVAGGAAVTRPFVRLR
jgi:glucose/arabinose dehydrogenase